MVMDAPELWWSPLFGVIMRRRESLYSIGPDGSQQLSQLPRTVQRLRVVPDWWPCLPALAELREALGGDQALTLEDAIVEASRQLRARHLPVQLGTRDERGARTHDVPGDVCAGCSDTDAGRWVPVSQCPAALAELDRPPGSPEREAMVCTIDRCPECGAAVLAKLGTRVTSCSEHNR